MAAFQHTNSKGVKYFLHQKDVVLRGGKNQTIYFFVKDDVEGKGESAPLPDGFEVVENPRNSFLTIRRIRA